MLLAALALPVAHAALPSPLVPSKPLWEQVPALICRGEDRMECAGAACEPGSSRLLWSVDFATSRIEFINGEHGYTMAGRFHHHYDTIGRSKHVVYFDGRLLDFDVDSQEGGELSAVIVGATFEKGKETTTTTRVSCYAAP